MSMYLGEIAALTTSVLWSTTSTFFTMASRRVGSMVLNRTRLVLAVLLAAIAHWLFYQTPFPVGAEPERWFWLTISGIVGLVLGDAFLYQAFIWIGPRLSMLMMSLAPVIAALEAWVFLQETLNLVQILGIIVTLSGIGWVVMEGRGRRRSPQPEDRNYLLGILFGLAAAAGQATGLILAKKGLAGDFPALSGTLIRMIAAAGTLWIVTIVSGQARATIRQLVDRPQAFKYIIAGTFTGPFLGVTFSLIAVQNTQVGVASTLMALPPVLLLPISYFFFQERFGWQAVTGTALAIGGVALLFMV